MPNLRFDDQDSITLDRALTFYLQCLSLPEDRRPFPFDRLTDGEVRDDVIRANQLRAKAYWAWRKSAGF